MAMTKAYYSVNGRILGEASGGTRLDYMTDALGSVTGTVDSSAQVVNTYRYKPYGELLARTGSGSDPRFRWVGSPGYRQTGNRFSDVYVRARHYGSRLALWSSNDPLALDSSSSRLLYTNANPSTFADPTGLFTVTDVRCGKAKAKWSCAAPNDPTIQPSGRERIAIVSGPMTFDDSKPRECAKITPQQAMRRCPEAVPRAGESCIIINGNLFDTASGLPLSPVRDCRGQDYREYGGEKERGPMITAGAQRIGGRHLFGRRGNCLKDNVPSPDATVPRTAGCIKRGGIVCFLSIGNPGANADELCKCMKSLCQDGTSVVLDGGSSTTWCCVKYGQAIDCLIGGSRAVSNYIIICGSGDCGGL